MQFPGAGLGLVSGRPRGASALAETGTPVALVVAMATTFPKWLVMLPIVLGASACSAPADTDGVEATDSAATLSAADEAMIADWYASCGYTAQRWVKVLRETSVAYLEDQNDPKAMRRLAPRKAPEATRGQNPWGPVMDGGPYPVVFTWHASLLYDYFQSAEAQKFYSFRGASMWLYYRRHTWSNERVDYIVLEADRRDGKGSELYILTGQGKYSSEGNWRLVVVGQRQGGSIVWVAPRSPEGMKGKIQPCGGLIR